MRVITGLERILNEEQYLRQLRGKRVGFCCNATSVTSQLKHGAEALAELPGVELKAIFGPEHGIWGTAQDMIPVIREEGQLPEFLKVPVYSLYGESEESLRPTDEMLREIDILLFDIQDIGARYYTYIYTLSYLMEAAAERGIPVWVLDRPNPIGGTDDSVEGPLLEPKYTSFVGRFPIAVRHGMTAGELAQMFKERFGINCPLTVVEMKGWSREMWFDQTGLPWVMPSPNMPTLDTATVYPGFCLLEGTNLSEGRGTTRPFEISGAPYINPFALVRELEAEKLPGVKFRPLYFQPTFQKWAGQVCGGVQTYPINREEFKPFLTGVAFILAARKLGGDSFRWRTEPYEFVSDRLAIDLLCGGTSIREAIERGDPLEKIRDIWKEDEEKFREERREFLIYK